MKPMNAKELATAAAKYRYCWDPVKMDYREFVTNAKAVGDWAVEIEFGNGWNIGLAIGGGVYYAETGKPCDPNEIETYGPENCDYSMEWAFFSSFKSVAGLLADLASLSDGRNGYGAEIDLGVQKPHKCHKLLTVHVEPLDRPTVKTVRTAMVDGRKYVHITNAADAVGMSKRTLERWVSSGDLKAQKINNAWFVNVSDVRKAMKDNGRK